jgi:hypothetical protein
MNSEFPEALKINNRDKLPTSKFKENDKLYHAFSREDLSEDGVIEGNSIRFPDFSCNWGRFSEPVYIRFRKNGNMTDGCYSFTVQTSRYKRIATPVHDAIDDEFFPNYSHVEVRELYEGEDILFEPPKNRKKKKSSKGRRLEYRKNLLNNVEIEIELN